MLAWNKRKRFHLGDWNMGTRYRMREFISTKNIYIAWIWFSLITESVAEDDNLYT